ncbi:MAG: hypothetical protein PF588_00255 [Candidatus Kapabacteria bacterium]|jgi:hypothetical protein|nr:hypothetical protein [Candidatus Kapabacteria bacterium]
MKIRLPLIVLLAILFASSNSYGQGDDPLGPRSAKSAFLIGPTAGVNMVTHAAKIQTFDNTFDDYDVNNTLCPVFEDGTGIGFWFGLTYEYPIGNPKTSTKSISGRIVYNYMPGTFEVGGDDYEALDLDQNVVMTTTKHDGQIDYSMLSFEAAFKLNISKKIPLGITVGPVVDLIFGKTHTQSYSLIEPNNVQFSTIPGLNYSNNNRTVTTYEGDLDGAASLRIGMKIGVQYEILMGKNMLVPVIYYNFGVTEATELHDWRVNAIQIGADFRFSIKSPF